VPAARHALREPSRAGGPELCTASLGGTLKTARTFPRTLASTGEVIDFAGGFAAAASLCERSAFVVRVVAEELFTNLLRHDRGGNGDIEVDLASSDGSLVLRLRDFGVEEPDMEEIELKRSEPPTLPVPERPTESPTGTRKIGGLGVRIVNTLTDRLEYDYADHTLTVTATIHTENRDVRPHS